VQIRLVTLGTLRCYLGEAELDELPGQRLRCAVLVYLAVERDATRETVASLLWPERDDERARHALSQKLYELRQILGEDWLQSQADRMRVGPALAVDAREFEAAVQRGALEEALSAYNGDFLAGFYLPESKSFESWVDSHRARLARLHRKARRNLIDQCVATGDSERAIAHARRWVELEPLEDEAQHRLIELLASLGKRAEAIRQYESYERALHSEELEPLDHTLELIARVRQSSAAPSQVATTASGVGGHAQSVVSSVPERAPNAPAASHRQRVAGIALAVVVGLGLAGWWTVERYARDSSSARSIAVLPFLNLSADPTASEHLSDGIAEELISALSHTDSLHVAARTSSFRFKGEQVSIRSIGDSLNVSLILEGSVRREGRRLRVAVRLVNVADGYQLWSNTFDRKLEDALSVQEEIAQSIARALRIRLAASGSARLAAGGTANTDAYEFFLRGRHLLQKGTRPAVMSAITYFDSAIARDPRYAMAYAQLAEANVVAAANRELPFAETLRTAMAAADRAIALAPKLSEAHAASGRANLELWNWSVAEREAVLAIQLDPRNASARAVYTGVLMVRGRTEEAVREAAVAMQIEPLSATAADDYADALRSARKYDLAVRAHHKALELEPSLGRQNLAKAYIELAMYDSALAQFRGALAAGAPRFRNVELLWTAYTYARAGNFDRVTPLLRQFEGRQPQGPNAYLHAALYMALADTARAFAIMERGVSQRSQAAWRQLPWDPTWDPVRNDKRFVRLLKQMNL
jgi:adenylate cyclase